MSDFKNRSRKLARDRYWSEHDKDSYTCPDCGRSESEIIGTFHVHHKSGTAYDNRRESLVGLCGFCHRIRERKKPSLRRIEKYRESGTGGADRFSHIMLGFVDEHICICAEGESYEWVDPISIWWNQLDSYLEQWGYRITDEYKSELICLLRQLPQAELVWKDSGAEVRGPGCIHKKNCDCVTRDDIEHDYREVMSDA